MIVARAPLRISFAGGGSDLPAYFEREPGAVLSAAIDRYMYITVNERFGGKGFRVAYSITETVNHVGEINHDIAREMLREYEIRGGLELTSVADVPAGTGLGSSGAYAVALACALEARREKVPNPLVVARTAVRVEVERCAKPVGLQDQWASAYGGLRLYQFTTNHVDVSLPINNLADFNQWLMLFYVGNPHNSTTILKQQTLALSSNGVRNATREMVDIAKAMRPLLVAHDYPAFADLLHKAWMLKRGLVHGITTNNVDHLYRVALDNGALGGKLCGAGGGGFMLLCVAPTNRDTVRMALREQHIYDMPFKFSQRGGEVVYHD